MAKEQMLTGCDCDSLCKHSIAHSPDLQTLKVGSQAEQLQGPGGETRWRLSDVIGREEGLGVECLSGSGAIASAYNRAFAEVTLTDHTSSLQHLCFGVECLSGSGAIASAYNRTFAEVMAPTRLPSLQQQATQSPQCCARHTHAVCMASQLLWSSLTILQLD